jgi:hypothetical protein
MAARSEGCGRGKKLKRKASELLEAYTDRILGSLLDRTTDGRTESVRLLLDLADNDALAEEAPSGRPLITLKQRLDAEPKLPADAPIEDWDEGSPEAEAAKEARAAG